MVATMDDGRQWNRRLFRRNRARRKKEEEHRTILLNNYTTDDDNNNSGKITQQLNSSREMEWMMMGMSKEGCAMGGGSGRMPIFSLTVKIIKGGGGEKGAH